jgi:hypothetical protein
MTFDWVTWRWFVETALEGITIAGICIAVYGLGDIWKSRK